MRIRSQRGFTGLEILAIIALMLAAAALSALVSGLWASSVKGKVDACVNQLNAVQSAMQAWVATVNQANPTGDKILCTTARNLVVKYNPQCGERIGEVPVPACE